MPLEDPLYKDFQPGSVDFRCAAKLEVGHVYVYTPPEGPNQHILIIRDTPSYRAVIQ